MPYGAIVDTVAGCYNAWCDVVADTVDSVLDDAIAVCLREPVGRDQRHTSSFARLLQVSARTQHARDFTVNAPALGQLIQGRLLVDDPVVLVEGPAEQEGESGNQGDGQPEPAFARLRFVCRMPNLRMSVPFR
mgnify:CR=1 FL=1